MTFLQVATDESTLTGAELLWKTVSKMGWRLVIDLTSIFILTRFIYYPNYKNRELFFTFYIFNIVIFLISYLLNKIDLSMGAAFGLFAVFSMLRYRTEDISIKDMTYLFLVIALGLVSSVTKIKGAKDSYEFGFLAGINAVILLVTFLLESKYVMRKENSKVIIYENIELIKSGREEELMSDMRSRTGIDIQRFTIQRIDFLRDTAMVKVYYYEK